MLEQKLKIWIFKVNKEVRLIVFVFFFLQNNSLYSYFPPFSQIKNVYKSTYTEMGLYKL